MRKYIFVTGGAVSDLGKTTLAASIGLLLSSRGFKVVNKKLNPCINISLGTLDPALSGEVYVNADGSEADLSLGFYERFTGEKQSRNFLFHQPHEKKLLLSLPESYPFFPY